MATELILMKSGRKTWCWRKCDKRNNIQKGNRLDSES